MKPIDLVASRLDVVNGAPPKFRARCPVHRSRTGTLAVIEAADGKVVMSCHGAGHCSAEAVVTAIGLTLADLFVGCGNVQQRDRERAEMRRQLRESPGVTIRAALEREFARERAGLRERLGFDGSPLHSREINAARRRVTVELGLATNALPPIASLDWECWPHSTDPEWHCLYERALEEETRRRWQAVHPEANAWDTDPRGPGDYDRIRAQVLARSWLQALAS